MTRTSMIGWALFVFMAAALVVGWMALLGRFAAPHPPMILPAHIHPQPLGGTPSIPGVKTP